VGKPQKGKVYANEEEWFDPVSDLKTNEKAKYLAEKTCFAF